MKRLTLLSFISLFIIMIITASNYSPGQYEIESTCQLSTEYSESGSCNSNTGSCKSDCSKSDCSKKVKSSCGSDCKKQCCSKDSKKKCGSNCIKPCCQKAGS